MEEHHLGAPRRAPAHHGQTGPTEPELQAARWRHARSAAPHRQVRRTGQRRPDGRKRGSCTCEACGVQSQRDYVLRTVEERGIRFVQLWFTDVLGTPKGFNITSAELENALDEGMTFDGSAIDGFSRVQEADVLARPDPKTFQLLPWHDDDSAVARVFCDVANLDGSPFERRPPPHAAPHPGRGPRRRVHLLRRPRDRVLLLRRRRPGAGPADLDSGSYFDLSVADLTSDLRRRSVLMLEEMGIPVEHTQHEDARSQHEIDLRYTDAMTMADTVMTARMVVKEMARREGVFASFMPKPLGGVQGSGMHTHISLWEGERNAFVDDERRVRPVRGGPPVHRRPPAPRPRDHGRDQPMGELLQAAHRRLRGPGPRQLGPQQPLGPGAGAGGQARQAGLDPTGVPGARQRLQSVSRLRGHPGRRAARHHRGLPLPPEADANLFTLSNRELASKGIESLPASLHDAVNEMERSELLAETLGDHVFEWFIRNKRAEWDDYQAQVTQFELDRYLPLL